MSIDLTSPAFAKMSDMAKREITDLIAEIERLSALVGDPAAGGDAWAGCTRADAIRQAEEVHADCLRWITEHDKRRAEREEARASAKRAQNAIANVKALWEEVYPDRHAGPCSHVECRMYRAASRGESL